jgi:hypothetical protein
MQVTMHLEKSVQVIFFDQLVASSCFSSFLLLGLRVIFLAVSKNLYCE